MTLLKNSMFYDILFPDDEEDGTGQQAQLLLQKVLRFHMKPEAALRGTNLVVFDFETTGLDSLRDRIIEIGAIRYEDGRRVGDFSTLVQPGTPVSEVITKITGITNEMLEGKPTIDEIMPDFLSFIDRSILVAHNAEFDMAFLKNACVKLGYQVEWPCFCTLKLARQLLPDLESKNLDTLARHFGLSFAARHRSIGDCEVTGGVLQALLGKEGSHLQQWRDMQAFQVS